MGVLDASTSPLKERYAVSNDSVTKLFSQEHSTINSPMFCATLSGPRLHPGFAAR